VVTRDAIVGTALRAITANGCHGLALRRVAREVGVSLATVQRHFATRDELWRACVDAVLTEPDPPDDGSGVEAELQSYLRAMIERATLSPSATAAMWNDSGPGSDERIAYLVDKVRPRYQVHRQKLAAAMDAGEIRAVDPGAVLALVGLGITSMASAPVALRQLFGIDLGDPGDRDALAAALADVLLHGMSAMPAAPPG
jgi:AcrR family transcriptional regulator